MRTRMAAVQCVVYLAVIVVPGLSLMHAQAKPWATAYYAGWMQGNSNNGRLPAQEIDYNGVTHIVHFSLVPRSDGSLDAASNSITAINSSELITRAHAAGKKVLISVGGWGSDAGFRGATSALKLTFFVTNLVTFMTTRGYDGIDLDWEVLSAGDAAQFTALVTALRTALNLIGSRPLLTTATAWQPGILAQVYALFDQINLMTYDLSGAWSGWVSWHNAPVYDGGYRFPSSGGLVPSVNGQVNKFLAAGIPASKLGIGIDFYGYVWSGGSGTSTGGVTEPKQSWTSAPSVQANVPYYTIMQTYYQPSLDRWDSSAQAAYIRIDNTGSTGDKFISYDNERSIQNKFDYVRSHGLGGVILWELGGGYRTDLPSGQRSPLLSAVKDALQSLTSAWEPSPTAPGSFSLSQNYPNPFNPSTAIEFDIPAQAHVTLRIYNLLGQEIATLVDNDLAQGRHRARWNAASVASGSYFYRLDVMTAAGAAYHRTRQMLLLK